VYVHRIYGNNNVDKENGKLKLQSMCSEKNGAVANISDANVHRVP